MDTAPMMTELDHEQATLQTLQRPRAAAMSLAIVLAAAVGK